MDILPESRINERDDSFFILCNNPFSFEAEAWIKHKGAKTTDTTMCTMNAGYLSGWCEECYGIELYAKGFAALA